MSDSPSQTNLSRTEIKSKNKIQNNHDSEPPEIANQIVKCKTCHITEYPTEKDPGLRECPRSNFISVYHSPKEGPEVVVINEMSDKYMGVVFSHRVHAEMSEMSIGCTGCHHYNTSGPVLNCRHCHEINRKRKDVSVPDLKAAYHRQCLTCHKQWSKENGCSKLCHAIKDPDQKLNIETISGKSHPILTVPEKIIWETNSKVNKTVTFYHDEHVQLFKINCTNCHTQESCIKCHSDKTQVDFSNPIKIEKSLEEHHKPCYDCHYSNSCQKCHNDKELTPFNHARSTGWSLNGYHSALACAKCHGSNKPYGKLNKNCVSCHIDFATEKFDHKLIGLIFSEAHSEIECENCHSKGDFESIPICTECHDDKSYPADLPGEKTKR